MKVVEEMVGGECVGRGERGGGGVVVGQNLDLFKFLKISFFCFV